MAFTKHLLFLRTTSIYLLLPNPPAPDQQPQQLDGPSLLQTVPGGSREWGWHLMLDPYWSRACQGSGIGSYLDASVPQLSILRRLLPLFPSPTVAGWYPEMLWEMDEVRMG